MSDQPKRNKIWYKNLTLTEKYQRTKRGAPFLFLIGVVAVSLLDEFTFTFFIIYGILLSLYFYIYLTYLKRNIKKESK
ncbi:hypothetical protein ATL39_2988 [Sinobaca qinghaiensis]|uniref:Uncharacterized protein n=1 Tax=Sinobaca qinghaiensis TaxID=342944 RepID=A0A419UWQ6_9BACL|nr:hypothetical protein [Sinobaca qinghaiensis]RKD69568.1 hypothetical protein ATL39_2988 [Sinobaca qinghaiensis]